MRTHLNLAQKGLLLVGAILAFELFFFCSLFYLIDQSQKEARTAAESKEVAGLVLDIFVFLAEARKDAKSVQEDGWKEEAITHYTKTMEELRTTLDTLKDRVEKYPRFKERLEGVIHKSKQIIKFVEVALKFLKEDNMYGLSALSKKYGHYVAIDEDTLQDFEGIIQEHEVTLGKSTESSRQLRNWMTALLVLGVAVNVVIALLLGRVFSRRIVDRVNLLIENARRFANNSELTKYAPEFDEIGYLDRSFRDMAVVLDEAARKERAIVENSSDVICSINPEFEFVRVSPASQTVWGIQPDELVRRPVTQLVASADSSEFVSSLQEVRAGQGSDFDLKVNKPDGGESFVRWSARWSENESSFFCVAHDITARKQAENILLESERKVRSILDNSVAGLIMLDNNGKIDFANDRAVALFASSGSQIAGKTIDEFLPQLSKTYNLSDAENSAISNKAVEVEARTESGNTFPAEASACQVDTTQGKRVLINVVDITERREVERMKEEFVAMISHDLRTPLGSVMGFIDLLSDGVYGELTKQGASRTDLAARNIRRLLRLINDLLEITKLESGKLELDITEFSTEELANRSLLAVKELADKSKVNLQASGADFKIKADEHRLERVIINLLSNAIKFSPADSTVTVNVERSETDTLFQVIDQGRGIPSTHLKSVFDRYKQVSATDSTELKGTGLGLAICKAIVEQHGGEIDVESLGIEGKGSTFWFRIPHITGGESNAG